jgi:hypothetical protein
MVIPIGLDHGILDIAAVQTAHSFEPVGRAMGI